MAWLLHHSVIATHTAGANASRLRNEHAETLAALRLLQPGQRSQLPQPKEASKAKEIDEAC